MLSTLVSPPTHRRLQRAWILAVALLLAATAALKLHAALLQPERLPGRERVLDLPLASWALLAGLLESGVVTLLLSAPQPRIALWTIRVFFAAILGYRLLLALHGGGYCACLGTLLADHPIQGQEGLVLGSVAFLTLLINELFLWSQPRRLPHSTRPSHPSSTWNAPTETPC